MRPDEPSRETATPPPDLLTVLRPACDGLLFPSESDRPVTPFLWARADLEAGGDAPETGGKPAEVSALTLLAAGEAPDGANIVQVKPDDFLRPVVDKQDWWGKVENDRAVKFRALRDTLNAHLSGLTVLRVGETEIDVYLLGRTLAGDVAGVHTQLVET